MFNHDIEDERPSKRSRPEDDFPAFVLPSEVNRPKSPKRDAPLPVFVERDPLQEALERRAAEARRQQDIAKIIAAAAAAATEAAKKPAPEPRPGPSSGHGHGHSSHRKKSSSSKSKKLSKEEREANKEKRLLKLIGAVVVKCMSKYKDQMDHDLFKKYAKEVRCSLYFFEREWKLTQRPCS